MFFLRRKKQDRTADLHALQQVLPDYVRPRLSTRAQRLTLKFDMADGCFDLVLPERSSLIQARDFALRHHEWMQQRLDQLETPIFFTHGAVIPFLGENHQLVLDKNLPYRQQPFIEANKIISGGDETLFAGRVARFLKAQAQDHLQRITHEKAAKIDKKVGKIMVRDAKTRWGSCNSEGTICYSWRLILAPAFVMEYVVAHEVAHLVHLDHSKSFWRQCDALCHEMKAAKKWLKTEGRSLHRYKSSQ